MNIDPNDLAYIKAAQQQIDRLAMKYGAENGNHLGMYLDEAQTQLNFVIDDQEGDAS